MIPPDGGIFLLCRDAPCRRAFLRLSSGRDARQARGSLSVVPLARLVVIWLVATLPQVDRPYRPLRSVAVCVRLYNHFASRSTLHSASCQSALSPPSPVVGQGCPTGAPTACQAEPTTTARLSGVQPDDRRNSQQSRGVIAPLMRVLQARTPRKPPPTPACRVTPAVPLMEYRCAEKETAARDRIADRKRPES